MFKRKRKSDPKIPSKDTADGTSRSDFSEGESSVLQDTGARNIVKNEAKKKKKKESSALDRGEKNPKILTKNKETATVAPGGNDVDENNKEKKNHAKLESSHPEDAGVKSLADDSYVMEMSGNRSSKSSGLFWPDVDCEVCKAGEVESKEYQLFLRNMDSRATGSTVIQSEDSYEKLRYSIPGVKRFKEATVSPDLWKAKRNFYPDRKESGKKTTTRDMETRNSDDIIMKGDSKNRRLMQSGNSRLQKGRKDEEEDEVKKVGEYREDLDCTVKSSGAPRVYAEKYTEMTTCCSLEEIRSLEKSLLRFMSESRLTMAPKTDDNQSSATLLGKMPQEKINLHVLVANAGCGHIADSRSPVNDSSITKTKLGNNFWPRSHESKKSCRCGNGCGTSDKSTCCCGRI